MPMECLLPHAAHANTNVWAVLQANVPLAFASDWPVVPIEPLLGMYTAVHRRSPDMAANQARRLERTSLLTMLLV